MNQYLRQVALIALAYGGVTLFVVEVRRATLQQAPAHNQAQPSKAKDGDGVQSKTEAQRTPDQHNKKGAKENRWYDFLPELWAFFREHPTEWLLVLFNGLLVLLNLGLWLSTRGLWKAAKEQAGDMKKSICVAEKSVAVAQAALGKERPHVFMEVLEPGIGFNDDGTHNLDKFTCRFKYQFRNYGKSVGMLTELCETFPQTATPTDLPGPIDPNDETIVRGRKLPSGILVGEEPFSFDENLFARTDVAALTPKGSTLFFLGYVRYCDMAGYQYITGFCAGYDAIGGRFVLLGDERYNYTRTETD